MAPFFRGQDSFILGFFLSTQLQEILASGTWLHHHSHCTFGEIWPFAPSSLGCSKQDPKKKGELTPCNGNHVRHPNWKVKRGGMKQILLTRDDKSHSPLGSMEGYTVNFVYVPNS